jgi:hypothetical protein
MVSVQSLDRQRFDRAASEVLTIFDLERAARTFLETLRAGSGR